MSYRSPVPLGPGHELDGFTCASAEQSAWLTDHAPHLVPEFEQNPMDDLHLVLRRSSRPASTTLQDRASRPSAPVAQSDRAGDF